MGGACCANQQTTPSNNLSEAEVLRYAVSWLSLIKGNTFVVWRDLAVDRVWLKF